MKNIKIILDTNLWISFLITRNFNLLDNFVYNKSLKLVFSKELLNEFLTVSQRPKFKKYFHSDDIQNLLHIFDNFGILVEVTSTVADCRDVNDNFLLNLAIDSKADYLVTGDNDLLELNMIGNTKIVTIKHLYKVLTGFE